MMIRQLNIQDSLSRVAFSVDLNLDPWNSNASFIKSSKTLVPLSSGSLGDCFDLFWNFWKTVTKFRPQVPSFAIKTNFSCVCMCKLNRISSPWPLCAVN